MLFLNACAVVARDKCCCKSLVAAAKYKKTKVEEELVKYINELDFEGKYSFRNSGRFQELEDTMITRAAFLDEFEMPPHYETLLPKKTRDTLSPRPGREARENVVQLTTEMLVSQPCISAITKLYKRFRKTETTEGGPVKYAEVQDIKSSELVRMIILVSKAEQITRHKWSACMPPFALHPHPNLCCAGGGGLPCWCLSRTQQFRFSESGFSLKRIQTIR